MTFTTLVVALAALCGALAIGACAAAATAPPPPIPAAPAATPVVPAPVVPAASAPQASAQPDADVLATLHIGESVTLSTSTPAVTFTDVSDDSRCPTNVTCVWAGDAAVTLRVQPAKGAAEVKGIDRSAYVVTIAITRRAVAR